MATGPLLLLLLALGGCESARILAAVPFPSISHQLPMRMLALELVKRGHQVTFITTDPIKKTIENYTEVDISPAYRFLRQSANWMEEASKEWNPLGMLSGMRNNLGEICEDGLKSPEMLSFIRSAPQFDLYILERALTPCFYGVSHVVGSPPSVGFVTVGAYPYTHLAHGNPNNPAYSPPWILPYSDHMTFGQRLYSACATLLFNWNWFASVLPLHDEIQRKYLGPQVPSIFDLERNFSLMLTTNHFVQSYPRPNLPNFIELTGLHIEKEPKPLPKDIQEWLDGASAGAVYFSLGTNVLGSSMPEQKRRAFLQAFAQLPQRVLWKWEADSAPDLPPNVRVAKWLPQQAVLAHPNVKLFITQGGLQSFNEATYYGVPLVGIPFMGDQHYNVAKMVSAQIGYALQFRNINSETVLKAIQTVLGDKRYHDSMKRLSAVYRDHQAESLPRAVWWLEYVLRHRGAPHLRSAAADLSWYQLLLLDVGAFVLAVLVAAASAVYLLLKLFISCLCKPKKLKSQ